MIKIWVEKVLVAVVLEDLEGGLKKKGLLDDLDDRGWLGDQMLVDVQSLVDDQGSVERRRVVERE